jgi:hypothetical protein
LSGTDLSTNNSVSADSSFFVSCSPPPRGEIRAPAYRLKANEKSALPAATATYWRPFIA